jgi:alanine dehydrogenase
MQIAIPKEIKKQEYRVGLLPSVAYQLVQQGHTVLVERGAGEDTGYPDADYEQAGAKLIDDHEALFAEGDLVVKVKEPLPEEYGLLRPGQVLFTYFHLAADRELTEAVCRSGVTALAYETIEVNGRLPLLEPMSEIAGRMSVLVGGYFLARHFGGAGILLGGVAGVLPGRVMVLGGGVAGVNAARMATGLNADVTILEVDVERMRFLDITLHTAHTLYSSEAHILEQVAARGPVDRRGAGARGQGAQADQPRHAALYAPRQRACRQRHRPGRLRRDLAPDQPHHAPVFVEEGVTHYCVANMPAAYSRTATQALTNVTHRYVEMLANHGLAGACALAPELVGGINTHNGQLTCPAVGQALGLEWQEPKL